MKCVNGQIRNPKGRPKGSVGGRTAASAALDRLEWPVQKERIAAFARCSRGRVILDAPSGYHDDCVMALADHGRWEQVGVGSMARLGVGEPRWGWRLRQGFGGRGRERGCERCR